MSGVVITKKEALRFYEKAKAKGSVEAKQRLEDLSQCFEKKKEKPRSSLVSALFSKKDKGLGNCIFNGNYAIVLGHKDVKGSDKEIISCSEFYKAFQKNPLKFDAKTNTLEPFFA